MLDQFKRWVFFNDQQLTSRPEGAPPIEMRDIMKLLQVRQQAGKSVKLINNKTAAIRIQDMTFCDEHECVVLLLSYCDTNAADPVFEELETGVLRSEPKLEGEGVAISAHAMISLRPKVSHHNIYLMLLEDVPGIGKTKLDPFFNSEFKEVSDFSWFDADDSKRKSCRPVSETVGHPSQTLRNDLERGVLQNMELISYESDDELDEEGETELVRTVMTIKPKRKSLSGSAALDVVEKVKMFGRKHGFTNQKIRFKRTDAERQRTVPINTAREDAGDALYTRYEVVTVGEPLPQCSDTIRKDVVDKMVDLLKDARRDDR